MLSDGTLKTNFLADVNCGATFFKTETGEYFEEYKNYSGISKEENDFIIQKSQETTQTRSSSLQEINNIIQNGNIDFTTLSDALGFLGESYVDARPTDCLYCNTHEEMVPER
jgi:hypothetical protein